METLREEWERQKESVCAEVKPGILSQWGPANLPAPKYIITRYGGGDQMWQYFKNGIPLWGDIPWSSVYDEAGLSSLKAEQAKKEGQKDALRKSVMDKHNDYRNPKRAPNWVSKVEARRSYGAFGRKTKGAVKVQHHQVDPDRLTLLFPVPQKGKRWSKKMEKFVYSEARPCADARFHNTQSFSPNKMTFGSHPLLFAISAMLLGVHFPWHASSAKPLYQAIQPDPVRVQRESEVPPFTGGPQKQSSSVASAKVDWRSHFYILPARHVQYAGIWNPDAEEYEFYKVHRALFGNLHSIFGATILSEAIAGFLVQEIKLLFTIYAGDTIQLAIQRLIQRSCNILRKVYAVLGIEVAGEKCEICPTLNSDLMEVLGLEYKPSVCDGLRQVEVDCPARKLDDLKRMLGVAIASLGNKRLEYKLAASITGSLVYAIYFRRHHFPNLSSLSPLFKIQDEPTFNRIISNRTFRKQLAQAYRDIWKMLLDTPALVIGNDSITEILKTVIYSDASLENGMAMLGAVLTESKQGGSPKVVKWFSVEVHQIKGACKKVTILYLELLAALLATKVFSAASFTVAMDNQAALYPFVKALVKPQEASMLSLAWQSIVVNRQVRLFYIPSEDNVGDLPTRPERISFNAPNNMLPRSKQVGQAHVRKFLRHSIAEIQKVTRRHAPHLAHTLPGFVLK